MTQKCSDTNFELGISSIGGVGSSTLLKFISMFRTTNRNDFHHGTSPYKHSMRPLPNNKLPATFKGKYIFVVGNVYDSILSLFADEYMIGSKQPRINHSHLLNKGLSFDHEISQDEYFREGIDLYKVEEQLDNWINCKKKFNDIDYDIMIVKYEEMFHEYNIKKILEFAKIPESEIKRFPKWRPRKNNIKYKPKHKYHDKIIDMYNSAQSLVDSLDDITII